MLNLYPAARTRQAAYLSKRETLLPRAARIGAAAAGKGTAEALEAALAVAGTEGLDYAAVYGAGLEELYTVENSGRDLEGPVLLAMAGDTLETGRESFRCEYREGAVLSYACAPILEGGAVTGAVGIYERDALQGALLRSVPLEMAAVSAVLVLAALAIGVSLVRTLGAGFAQVTAGIRRVREGDYGFRVELRGRDEFTELAGEFNDLTERVQKTEERRRRFVSDVSHELKTPLAAIRLLSDSILENGDMDRETVREFASGIKEESERMSRTTLQLLNLARYDQGGTFVRTRIDCVRVAERALEVLGPVAAEAGITVTGDLGTDCFVMATEDDIFQIIHNLLDNAVKYNVDRGRVTLSVRRREDRVVVTVEDTGIGISDYDLPFIFERFYRVEKSRNRPGGGTGLGLSIVKSAAERHGGGVTVRRASPQGTVFTVTLPAAPPPEEDESPAPEEAGPEDGSAPR